MPRNAATGVYTRVSNSFSSPVLGTLIDPTDAEALFDDQDVGMNPPILDGPVAITVNTTAWAALGTTALHVIGPPAGEARIELTAVGSDCVVAFGRLNGSLAASTHLLSGEQMMGLTSGAIDTNGSTTMQQGGAIGAYCTQDWSATQHSTEFRFYTIPQSSVNLLLAAKMLDSGGMWINKNTTATGPITSGTTNPVLQLQAADGARLMAAYDSFGTNTGSFGVYRSARGTAGGFTASQINDTLGGFGWVGAIANDTFPNPLPFGAAGGAFILAVAAENWTNVGTHQGTSLQFYTTPTGSATIGGTVSAMHLQASGGLSIGTSSDPGGGMIYTNAAAFMIRTKTSYTNGGGGGTTPTLGTNGPTGVTTPTKWIPVDDNGTTRYIPAW